MDIVFYIIIAITLFALYIVPIYAIPVVFITFFFGSKFLDDNKELSYKRHLVRATKVTVFAFIAVWIVASVFSGEGYGGMHRYG